MTTAEFKREFQIMYDSASQGAPDLNNYEISLFLTQAIRDIIQELYNNFEYSEYNKRALSPLIKEDELVLVDTTDYFPNIHVKEAILPLSLYYLLQENVKLTTQCGDLIEVVSEDLDNINKTLKNPFKKPNKRKVLRTQIGASKVRLYSSIPISKYKVKYINKYTPIIVSNFSSDTELLGTETIDGLNTISNTELPIFIHDKIVKRGVQIAIKSLRENNLKTQIEV